MKVAYIGNFRHDFCTESHLTKTMESLGVEVHKIQEDELEVASLDAELEGCDLLLYTRTWGVDDIPLFSNKLKELKKKGFPTASYHLDLYHGISREKGVVGDPFWETEYVFTPDGSKEAEVFFESHDINHFYLKPGVFDQECYVGKPQSAYSIFDVGFVGTVDGYHPEWPHRFWLHKCLEKFYGKSYTKQGHPETLLRGDDLNNFYATVPVIVGDTLCPGYTKTHYWSDRVYETIGRGGFLIHPYIKGLEEEFTEGETIAFYKYGDFEGLKRKIDHYLNNPEERAAIQAAGQKLVKKNCTYVQRIKQAFGVMGYEL